MKNVLDAQYWQRSMIIAGIVQLYQYARFEVETRIISNHIESLDTPVSMHNEARTYARDFVRPVNNITRDQFTYCEWSKINNSFYWIIIQSMWLQHIGRTVNSHNICKRLGLLQLSNRGSWGGHVVIYITLKLDVRLQFHTQCDCGQNAACSCARYVAWNLHRQCWE